MLPERRGQRHGPTADQEALGNRQRALAGAGSRIQKVRFPGNPKAENRDARNHNATTKRSRRPLRGGSRAWDALESGRRGRGQDKAENRDARDHNAQDRNDQTIIPFGHVGFPVGHVSSQPFKGGIHAFIRCIHLLLQHGNPF